ncbi:diacylglycerol acyltransferase-domain-containing protein [Globomyces pollinis-pini]|nr:diacylglycerol acyltransferase-domain-containing protein [Globomyces pollinis-pini]
MTTAKADQPENEDYKIIPESYPTSFTVTDRILQFIAVNLWLFSLFFIMIGAPVLVLVLFYYSSWSRFPILVYFGYIFLDTKTPIVGMKRNWFRSFIRHAKIWDYFRAYFPAQIIRTKKLDPSKKYIIGVHPHGVYAIAPFCNIIFNRHVEEDLFPGIHIIMSTLPANFSVPIWRDYALALGSGSCERKSIKQRLLYGKPGTSMMIAIGGAEEFKYMTEGTLDLVLLKRKGFAKIALMTGASPVPVIGFGENELYHRVTHSFFQPLHGVFQTLFKAAAPLFYGQFGTLFPKQHPLVTVGNLDSLTYNSG